MVPGSIPARYIMKFLFSRLNESIHILVRLKDINSVQLSIRTPPYNRPEHRYTQFTLYAVFDRSAILALLQEHVPALVRASAGAPVILFRTGAPVQTGTSVQAEAPGHCHFL